MSEVPLKRRVYNPNAHLGAISRSGTARPAGPEGLREGHYDRP